ncbi:MAG: glucose-6-phosphate isomerase [Lachnospiraceae bacterium]|nr:glucose-6-phosphate isomerase [Lachnospiraceae bacterium]
MGRVTFDHTYAGAFIGADELEAMGKAAESARQVLLSGEGPGSDYTGWIDLPEKNDREEFARIKDAAARIRENSEVFLVIGIGGSYLGARAANEFLNHDFYNLVNPEKRNGPQIFYCGNNLSSSYIRGLVDVIGDRDFSINMISKSGTTTEPAVSFRVFRELAEKKYGREGAAKRIFCTTDKARGALKQLADSEGYETFVVPDDIGGRYSVLTAVGLLPIAVSGVDIEALMEGAADAMKRYKTAPFEENAAMQYAACRNILLGQGKVIEIIESYEPSAQFVAEWWKQLFGESEGKDHKGIFPASVTLTADLHSMGQFIQDGTRNLFETVLDIEDAGEAILMKEEAADTDGLNYLAGKDVAFINRSAMQGTILAHNDGGVPVLKVNVPTRDARSLGELFYFFEFACGVSGNILGVNPFNQPGVEAYKKNMFMLLGKPGYTKA